jgi:cystathionine gamma-lyase
MKFATKLIRAGQDPDPHTGSITVPIHQTSTYKQDGLGALRGGWEYSRTGNPSRASLERTIATLEGAEHGLAFSSGSAATAAVLHLLSPGDEAITTIDVYGGTYRLLNSVYGPKNSIQTHFLNTDQASEILSQINEKTRLIWIESPTNPLLSILDIQALADGKPENVLLVVDNTFATPYFQRPLELGADIVVHSTTKYLGGHSDVIGGAAVTKDAALAEQMAFYQNAAGAVPGPMDCFLTQRGIKTLAVRMQAHEANTWAVAKFLKEHPRAIRVYFPGFKSHPNHAVVAKQMKGQTGMVSFTIDGGREEADAFLRKLEVFTLAESLGGVESLACYPYTMTHHAIPEPMKQEIGIGENLIRLSVGIEDREDLLADLEQALA